MTIHLIYSTYSQSSHMITWGLRIILSMFSLILWSTWPALLCIQFSHPKVLSVAKYMLNKHFPSASCVWKKNRSATVVVFLILNPTHIVPFHFPPKSIERKQYNQGPEANHSLYWTHVYIVIQEIQYNYSIPNIFLFSFFLKRNKWKVLNSFKFLR